VPLPFNSIFRLYHHFLPPPDKHLFLDFKRYLSFRDAISDKPLSYLCFQVLYWTGMREGELLALTAADIDLEEKLIDINKTYQQLHGEDIVTTPKAKKSQKPLI
jgi:integrase